VVVSDSEGWGGAGESESGASIPGEQALKTIPLSIDIAEPSRNNCTLAPWYGLPKEYLPASLPTFLPALLTLFNLLGKLEHPACVPQPRLNHNVYSYDPSCDRRADPSFLVDRQVHLPSVPLLDGLSCPPSPPLSKYRPPLKFCPPVRALLVVPSLDAFSPLHPPWVQHC